MGVTIFLHKIHQKYVNGKDTVTVEGKSVEECLRHLTEQYPDIRGAVLTDNGTLNPVIEIYVNGESAYPDELKKPVKDGDKIYLLYTLAGG